MAIPFDLWGQRGYPSAEVAGESHHYEAIRLLFPNGIKPDGNEIMVTAALRPEPTNKYDRNAVGVWIDGALVGHLPRDEAARYAPVLARLVAAGHSPQVGARVWAAEWDDGDGRPAFRGSVRLDLAEPHLLTPVNMPPADHHRLLPAGTSIQVSGEDKHLDALAPFLRPEGECCAYATLHEFTDTSARTSRTLLEVRLDGDRVGQLTPKMSGDLLPAVRHLAEHGVTAAAQAIVKGNRIKAEVVLYAMRAHELPESWLQYPAVPRQHASIPARPSGIRFAVPPEWPQPPDGWEPQAGWRPDPSWPPAPPGWQWWVPVW